MFEESEGEGMRQCDALLYLTVPVMTHCRSRSGAWWLGFFFLKMTLVIFQMPTQGFLGLAEVSHVQGLDNPEVVSVAALAFR